MKWYWDHVEWGESSKHPGVYSFYFYFWDWRGLKDRDVIPFFTFFKTWYDGPHVILRLGPMVFSWSTQWTTYEKKWDER
jgi:hypothetical protein